MADNMNLENGGVSMTDARRMNDVSEPNVSAPEPTPEQIAREQKIASAIGLFERTMQNISSSGERWCSHLDTAAAFHKYSFADQLMIGAQRPDATAVAELKTWNTGHPGGISTIHSDNCYKTLGRLRTLIARGGAVNQEPFIAEAINLILYVDRIAGFGPVLSQIMEVHDYDNVTGKYDVNWIKRGFELLHSSNDGDVQTQGV